MSLDALIPSAVDGLMLGFVYGLAAMGLTLIFGVMKVINLSHGPIIALGMFTVLLLSTTFGVNPYLGLVAAVVLGLVFGVVMYFIAVDRVINAPELTTLLATFSVNLMIIGIGTAVFTTSPRAVDVDLGALLSTLFSFTILSGTTYEIKSFVIVVLGGLGNPAGALVGGIILGLLEGVTTVFIPVSWVPVLEYAIFVLILLVRPSGLLGSRA